jgi:hypothetical protein
MAWRDVGALPDPDRELHDELIHTVIGLSLHGGIPYRSRAVLVDRCARARGSRSEAT